MGVIGTTEVVPFQSELKSSFSAACKATLSFQAFGARMKSSRVTRRRLLAIPERRFQGSFLYHAPIEGNSTQWMKNVSATAMSITLATGPAAPFGIPLGATQVAEKGLVSEENLPRASRRG
jgi:hypothetical protein